MLRAFSMGIVGMFGVLAAIVVGIVSGVQAKSWGAFFIVTTIGMALVVFAYKAVDKVGRISMADWLSRVSSLKYKYAWDGSGIAIDQNKNKVHIASRFSGKMISKTYSFSEIREWGYEIKGKTIYTGSQVFGGGLRGAAHNVGDALGTGVANVMSAVIAAENTGLWLKVADIDFPKWFIKFKPQKNLEMELTRWMEILQQSFNEAK